MLSENRNIYFRGSFQFSIVTIQKMSPLWKSGTQLPKIAYFNGKKSFVIYLNPNLTPDILGCYDL